MKKIFSLIIVAAIGFLMISALFESSLTMDSLALKDRVSMKYIEKSVTEETGEVIYGESENLEDGSANIVTSIVADYRSFDTLGEVTVLFLAAFGVAFVIGGVSKRFRFAYQSNFILKIGARLVFGFILLNGLFMAIHGHLTPGGGFPGGTMMAAAMLLLYAADNDFRASLKGMKVLEGTAGSIYVLIGIIGLILTGFFLGNFLNTGVVGELFSAGIIPIVYILIGLKVGAEISGVLDNFLSEEVAE